METHDSQDFLSLYYEPNVVETAVGDTNPHVDALDWKRERKSLGQIARPQTCCRLDGALGYVA
jgi:hypothetical protein